MKIRNIKNKRAQEEIVGFALIIIMVAVILVVLLGFYLKSTKKQSVQSYEADSFLQSALQFTTDCSDNRESLSIQKVILKCVSRERCDDERDACAVLDSTLNSILAESWKTEEDSPISGLELIISSKDIPTIIAPIKQGITTRNSKSGYQGIPASRGSELIDVGFTIYYS